VCIDGGEKMSTNAKVITINDIEVSFKRSDNEIFSDTLSIAKVFGEKHKNVLAKLRQFPNYGDLLGWLNFKPTQYHLSFNRRNK